MRAQAHQKENPKDDRAGLRKYSCAHALPCPACTAYERAVWLQ